MLTEDDRQAAAEAILDAGQSGDTCVQPSRIFPGLNLSDAYDIQARWLALRLEGGASLAGRKVGLSSLALRTAAKAEAPDYGAILAEAIYPSGAVFAKKSMPDPRVAPALVFKLKTDLAADCRISDVLAATGSVQPALEVSSDRTEAPRKVLDGIADNGAFAAVVMGEGQAEPDEAMLPWIGAVLSKNDVVEETGLAASVMGHPAEALVWLAGEGVKLSAGDLVLVGGMTRPISAKPGDTITADFGPLGKVVAAFS